MEHGCPGTDHVVTVADNAAPDAVATRQSFAAFAAATQTVEYDVIEYVVAQVFGVSRGSLRAGSRGRAHVAEKKDSGISRNCTRWRAAVYGSPGCRDLIPLPPSAHDQPWLR